MIFSCVLFFVFSTVCLHGTLLSCFRYPSSTRIVNSDHMENFPLIFFQSRRVIFNNFALISLESYFRQILNIYYTLWLAEWIQVSLYIIQSQRPFLFCLSLQEIIVPKQDISNKVFSKAGSVHAKCDFTNLLSSTMNACF